MCSAAMYRSSKEHHDNSFQAYDPLPFNIYDAGKGKKTKPSKGFGFPGINFGFLKKLCSPKALYGVLLMLLVCGK